MMGELLDHAPAYVLLRVDHLLSRDRKARRILDTRNQLRGYEGEHIERL